MVIRSILATGVKTIKDFPTCSVLPGQGPPQKEALAIPVRSKGFGILRTREMTTYSQGFSPQNDRYQRMRRWNPSPMQGATIDRAAERLTVSGFALSDLPAVRLARLLHEDLTRAEYHAALDELRRRTAHATHESDCQVLAELIAAKVVTL